MIVCVYENIYALALCCTARPEVVICVELEDHPYQQK
jgi:hypothetical protein